jgi:hypothetical protein
MIFKASRDETQNTQGKGNAPNEECWDCMGHDED